MQSQQVNGTHLRVPGSGYYRLYSRENVPAERDVDGQFVDLSLVRKALVAGVGQEGQPVIGGVDGVVEAVRATLQSDKSLILGGERRKRRR